MGRARGLTVRFANDVRFAIDRIGVGDEEIHASERIGHDVAAFVRLNIRLRGSRGQQL